MKATARVLFVVENDYYPRDMRVYNECTSLSEIYSCYVLAPRQKGEALVEDVGSVRCFRYPHFEAKTLKGILFEYLNAAFWIAAFVPIIALTHRIAIIHVANPPDFIIPAISWLKLFRKKLIYDVHDLSVETFKGKSMDRSPIGAAALYLLRALESASIFVADVIVVTNTSIRDYVKAKSERKRTYVVRNSNRLRYRDVGQIDKAKRDGRMRIGYFGILADDEAAGLDNFFVIADALTGLKASFKFLIVGSGPGLEPLRRKVRLKHMEDKFEFHGFVPMPDAFGLIKDFDFGLVTWGYLPKNHVHTAMKVMDYMACGVPVGSLMLKEQLASTGQIGIHANTFEEMARQIVECYENPVEYEALRQHTLEHFNAVLAWELQERNLRGAYDHLLKSSTRASSARSEA